MFFLIFTQAVCTTLLEFSDRIKDEATQRVIVQELATILGQHCQDVAWCVEVVSPNLLTNPNPDKRIIEALIQVMERGNAHQNSLYHHSQIQIHVR